jgi:very-short-patch-repair endonuclease
VSDFKQFLNIRKAYAAVMPEWMEAYEATGEMRQEPYFMDWEFSPIEHNVWGDIRQLGMPMFPQLPALNYFLDFGNPFLKIGIECDGKAWHDADLDRARDARLAAAGWMIFRIDGHECKRLIDTYEYGDVEQDNFEGDDLMGYYGTTSEGILRAIHKTYFCDANLSDREQFCINASLFEHRSTPDNFPQRHQSAESTTPCLMRDCMDEYMDLIMRRLARAAA